MDLTVYYDGECPFCSRYVSMVRLQRTTAVRLIDLRENSADRERLLAEGHDTDQGMVVEIGERRVDGAEAASLLAALSTGSDTFNRLNRALLARPWAAKVLYPVLRLGRWLSLAAMGRTMMGDDRRDEARSEIFGIMFALFSVFHFFNYVAEYMRFPPTLDLVAVLLAAIVLFLRPSSPRALFALMLASTVSTVLQAPIASNHTMVRSALLLGYWLSFGLAWFRNRPPSTIFSGFAPAGQAALLVMYFFGVFHKLNTDFLDPDTSCAVVLWNLMPRPLSLWQGPVIEALAIYGTFAVEGAIMAALLFRKTRHIGIAAGIAFHLLLSLSSYAMYISFTSLSIALHALFLTEDGARKVLSAPAMAVVRDRMHDRVYQFAALGVVAIFAMLAFTGHYTFATLAVLPIALPFCYLILRHGASDARLWTPDKSRAGPVIGVLVGALFFLNCAMPYLGLKTGQAINMFANLRLEGGVSNHLVFPEAPRGYLQQVAIIEDDGGSGYLGYFKRGPFGIVYHDLLAHLAENPELSVTFAMGGERFANVSAAEVQGEIDAIVMPRLLRKWFFFQPAKLDRPEPCNV